MNQPAENNLPLLSLSGVDHAYLGRTVLSGIGLSVFRHEVVALVGPSGCGKSTLAHIAAGVVDPLRGRIERRYGRHGMVFQEPRLLPWATARDNIAYPLRHRGIGRTERQERVRAAAARAALDPLDLDKYPVEMSGGMRQRTAIARALAMQPDMVYFDEPFTALDVALKRRMQDLVIAASRDASFSALFITHDLMEAVRIAHRVAVMDVHGRGIIGERIVPGLPGERAEGDLFELVHGFVTQDPLFRHIHDIDERRVS
jgi:NitT/TauT family transport system ATP-binding protein